MRALSCFLAVLLLVGGAEAWDGPAPAVEDSRYSVRLIGWSALERSKFGYDFSVVDKLTGARGVIELRNDTAYLLPGASVTKAMKIYDDRFIVSGWSAYSEVINVGDLKSLEFFFSFRAMSHAISPDGRYVIFESFRQRIAPPEAHTSVISLVDLSELASPGDGNDETQLYAGRVIFPEGAEFGLREHDPSKRINVLVATWLWSSQSDRAYVIALSDGKGWLLAFSIDDKQVTVEKKVVEGGAPGDEVFSFAESASWSEDGDIVIHFRSFGDSGKRDLVIPMDRAQ